MSTRASCGNWAATCLGECRTVVCDETVWCSGFSVEMEDLLVRGSTD